MALFDELYSASDAEIKKKEKPLAERSIKRRLESAADQLQDLILTAETRIQNERNKIARDYKSYNVAVVLEAQETKAQAEDTLAAIQAESKALFGSGK